MSVVTTSVTQPEEMASPGWLEVLGRWLRPRPKAIDPELWRQSLAALPALSALGAPAQAQLLQLSQGFLARKQFHGAHGLVITDAMATRIAAQACLPLVHWALRSDARRALAWYDGFVCIVVHADEVLAPREVVDDGGVVHRYRERLAGEAMDDGPVMLNWHDVERAHEWALEGCNLVIHEFAHKIDMHQGPADGCPPLPPGFAGQPTARAARAHWRACMSAAYELHREQVLRAERFGAPPTWLDPYAAESPAEFFAVACEAFFMQPERLAAEYPEVSALLREFFSV